MRLQGVKWFHFVLMWRCSMYCFLLRNKVTTLTACAGVPFALGEACGENFPWKHIVLRVHGCGKTCSFLVSSHIFFQRLGPQSLFQAVGTNVWRSFILGISFHMLRIAHSAVKTALCADELVYQYFWDTRPFHILGNVIERETTPHFYDMRCAY
jgi:hypothetical protein